ncbi:hypothetical protein ACQP0C_19780 [Nocardia sp. CA-129566]|uniref:hypothetical protein n=1 Tax=Nocardia sp. CA-129566 TaxID=3239976 RepID=UPI003D99CE59
MSNTTTALVTGANKGLGRETVRRLAELPRVNAADPGYTATDSNGNSGHQTVTEGTDAIVHLATIGPDGPTGGFFNRFGAVPW